MHVRSVRCKHQVSCLCMKDVVMGFMQTSDVIFVHYKCMFDQYDVV